MRLQLLQRCRKLRLSLPWPPYQDCTAECCLRAAACALVVITQLGGHQDTSQTASSSLILDAEMLFFPNAMCHPFEHGHRSPSLSAIMGPDTDLCESHRDLWKEALLHMAETSIITELQCS